MSDVNVSMGTELLDSYTRVDNWVSVEGQGGKDYLQVLQILRTI